MKTKSLFAIAAAAMMALVSCENVVTPETPAGNPETYTVTLGMSGELDVTHVPLTKGESTDLYGIQVYYAPVSGGSYDEYAYGLFDDMSKATLELIADYKYKFVVDMIVDGKNVLYSDLLPQEDETITISGYGDPYRTSPQDAYYNYPITPVTNSFNVTSTRYFGGLGSYIELKNGKARTDAKGVDVYYGSVNGFVPTSDGMTLPIYMKRMVYGLKVTADDSFTEGTIEGFFYVNSSNNKDEFVLTPDSKVYEATYAKVYNRADWYQYEQLDNANTSGTIDFAWHKNDSTTLNLDWQSIKMIRMKQTLVNVTFYEDVSAGSTSLSLTFEDSDWTESGTSYTFGDDQSEYEW